MAYTKYIVHNGNLVLYGTRSVIYRTEYDTVDIAALLRNKIKFHIRDISYTDNEIDEVVLQVITDIANDTRIFKKIYGFTVYEGMKIYNFHALTKLNNRLEASSITIGGVTQESILDFLAGGENLPSPEIITSVFDATDHIPLEILDIYDSDGYSITNYFHYEGTTERVCYDEAWLKEHNEETMAFTASVVPDIQELREEELAIVTTAIIEGCKYYFSNTFESTNDGQITNLYYQRYWTKIQALINQFPSRIFAHKQSKKSRRRWK